MSQKSRVLTANQIEVVRWLTTPQKSRQPKIEAELAKEMGTRPATISKCRKKLDLDNHASEMVRQKLYRHLPEVYEVLVERFNLVPAHRETGLPPHTYLAGARVARPSDSPRPYASSPSTFPATRS